MEEQIKMVEERRVVNAHKYLAKMRGNKSKIHYQWDLTGPRKEYKKRKLVKVCAQVVLNGVVRSGYLHI